MSISSTLSNAISGMTAASRMAEIVSSNVSNSLTEGYGRRSLNLSAAVIGGRGAGVEIGSVDRFVDRGILSDRRLADANLGRFGSLATTMDQLQSVVGQAGSDGSISSQIVALESALIDASADPSSGIRLNSVGDRLAGLAQGLNTATDEIQGMRAESDASIADQVDQLNAALAQVQQLNVDISYALNTGNDPSGIMDVRQQVIDQIAQIVPIREFNRDNGQVALMTPQGESLIDGTAKVFGFIRNPVITPDMTIASSGLTGLTLDGVPIAADGVGKLTGGTLGAAFQARDVELVDAQARLDTIAADLITRFQNPAVDPTLTVGDPGLLTDAGAAYDSINLLGLAGRIAVNVAVDPSQGGQIDRLRDGVGATAAGPSGNAALLLSLSAAMAAPQSITGDPLQQSAAGRASSFEASIGSQRLSFDSELSFTNARWAGLKEAEAAGGVDTDYEMQMLLRIEQAYSANARVVQTVDSMMQRLMEI